MKKAIVVIDMQNDFIDGSLGTKEAQAIVKPVADFVAKEKAAGSKIIFTMDTHGTDYLQTAEGKKLPVEHCIKPQKGWEICPALQPFAKEAPIYEKSSFGFTELPPTLADYDKIVFCGLCTDVCVLVNALLAKAFNPEKQIIVKADLCAGITPEGHTNALNAMKVCQVEVE